MKKNWRGFYLDIVKKESVVWSPVRSKKSFKAKETTLIPGKTLNVDTRIEYLKKLKRVILGKRRSNQ